MAYLDELQIHLENNDLPRVLRLWEELCGCTTVDGTEFRHILEAIAASDLAAPLGAYMEMGVPLWSNIQDAETSYWVLRHIMDLQTVNSPLLAETALNFLKGRYGDQKHFNLKVALVGLRDKKNFRRAITNYELLSHMDKGKFVYHSGGWGAGEILDISLVREELVIEFENIGGKRSISFENAFNTLKPLDNSHFLVRRFSAPDVLEKEAHEDPCGIIKLLLKDLGPKTAAEIKEELCGSVIVDDDWSKWWLSAKTKMKKSSDIVTPKTVKDPFTLRGTDVSVEEKFNINVASHHTPAEIIAASFDFLKENQEASKNATVREGLVGLLNRLEAQQLTPSQTLEVALLLEDTLRDDVKACRVKKVVETCQNFDAVLDAITIAPFKRKALEAVRDYRNDWTTIFSRQLLLQQGMLRDYIFKELEEDPKVLMEALHQFIDDPKEHPEVFVWYFQKAIGGKDVPFSSKEEQCHLFEELLNLLHTIEGKPQYRDVAKKIYNILSAKRYAAIRSLIEGTPLDFVKEFLLLASKCQTFTTEEMGIFRSLAQVVHPSLMATQDKEDDNTIWTTEAGYNKVRERLRQFSEHDMLENAKEVEAARALGDLRENAEYKSACERRSRLQSELRTLSEQVHRARILTPNDVSKEEVSIGSVVDIVDGKGKKLRYTILGPWDADVDNGILSFKSGFAQGILGKKAGDLVKFKDEQFEIIDLSSYFDR